MKVIALKAENFKRLKAVEITPDGSLVEIRGRNGQGKTSVLDALWVALSIKGAPTVPIRTGAEEARIRLDLGEIVITRTFKRTKDGEPTMTLAVTAADGARYGSPQTMLDKLVGSLSFDPLAFSRMKPKDQFDQLRQFVPDVDFDAVQKAHDADYDKRRDINRQAKEAEAAAKAIALPVNAPAEPVDVTALVAELETAGQTNTQIEQRKQRRQRVVDQVAAKRTEAERHTVKASELRLEADRMDALAKSVGVEADDLQKQIDEAEALPEPVDTTAIRARIESARTVNAVVEQVKLRAGHLARAATLENQSEALTAAMDKRQADKLAAIAGAKMPVPGITFGDAEVLLNGVPFAQASDAEQLRASIAIAAAMNPKLRVIRVRDGSLLDTESLALVAQFAAENDLQVWAEIVDSKGATGIVIEDGQVREEAIEVAA